MEKKVDTSLSFWAERIVGLLAIGAIVFACFWIAAPLVGVLAWGALIAIALAPLHRMLTRASGNRPKTVATLMVLVLLGLVIFPLSFLPASFEGAAEGIASVTNNWTELKLPPPPSWLSSFPLFGPTINEKWAAAANSSREFLAAVTAGSAPLLSSLLDSGRKVLAGVLFLLPGIVSDCAALLLLALPLNLTTRLQPQMSGGGEVLDGEYRRLD